MSIGFDCCCSTIVCLCLRGWRFFLMLGCLLVRIVGAVFLVWGSCLSFDRKVCSCCCWLFWGFFGSCWYGMRWCSDGFVRCGGHVCVWGCCCWWWFSWLGLFGVVGVWVNVVRFFWNRLVILVVVVFGVFGCRWLYW